MTKLESLIDEYLGAYRDLIAVEQAFLPVIDGHSCPSMLASDFVATVTLGQECPREQTRMSAPLSPAHEN